MISQETMKQARNLTSDVVSNIFKQFGRRVDLNLIEENELTINCFDHTNNLVFNKDIKIKDNIDTLYFSDEEQSWRFVSVLKTDSGELAIADSGKLIYETISDNQNIDKVVVSTYPIKSSKIDAKPPILTDAVSTMLGTSALKDGGVSIGFFAKDAADNRQFLIEAIQQLREKEEFIILDEGRTFTDVFCETVWHELEKSTEKDGIVYVNFPDTTFSLAANEFDEFGDLANLMPFIEASRNIEREYTSVINAISTAESKKANSTALLGLTGLLQKSAEKVRFAHEEFNEKSAELAEEQSLETASPSISNDSEMEEKAKQSERDLARSKTRKR